MRLRSIGFLSLILVFEGCQSSTMTAAKLYEKQGDFLKAKDQWLTVLEEEPDNMEAHYSLGKIHGVEGEYGKMVRSFDLASGSEFQDEINLTLDRSWRSRFNDGVRWMDEDIDKAIQAFRDATVIANERLDAWQNLAVLYSRSERVEDALAIYEIIVKQSKDVDLMSQIGIYQMQEEAFGSAIETLKKVVNLDSLHFEGHYNLAIAQIKTNDLENAEKNLLIASEIDSLDISPQFSLGNLYWNRKDYTKALTAFSKAVEIDPQDNDALYNLAVTYLLIGNDQSALPLLKLLTERTPNNGVVWREIGGIYARQGRLEDSTNAYKREEELKK